MQMDMWRNNMVGCHCEPLLPLSLRAEGVAISVKKNSWGLLRRPSADGLPRNDTADRQSLFKLKMRHDSIPRSVHHLSELDQPPLFEGSLGL